jgi:hypothetical protein
VLDFDATAVPLHGHQEGRFFHGYYDCYCYLPLYVFCGQQLLCAYLRPSRIDAAQHAAAILKLLVRRLRQAWPAVRIVFRADSGFCRQRLMNWCERSGVHYVIGLARNARLESQVQYAQLMLEDEYRRTGIKQRWGSEFDYAAKTWLHERRVVTRLEWGPQGGNPRFVVTNLEHAAEQLYDHIYCRRGEAENRIKEAQIGLFATRTSCRYFAANQLRVLLAALGYVLVERRSTRCACGCSSWARSSHATRAASGCTWLRTGPARRSSRMRCACCARRRSHTAPGPRDDTNSARSPRRGGAIAPARSAMRTSLAPMHLQTPPPRMTSAAITTDGLYSRVR